jgi:Pyruvate/2-oxoacid:ferredoxin oxidoreductase delta subunit
MSNTSAWAAVARAVEAPEFLLPWLDRFYEPAEADVILALADGPLSPAALARALAAGGMDDAAWRALLERAHRRAVVTWPGEGTVSLADFRTRLEIWALFEGWKDVPAAIRERVCDWDLDAYAESIRADVGALRDGTAPPGGTGDYAYLLLEEGERLIAEAEHVYLWPCDCRALWGRCRKPVNVCLRFANDRSLGWEISKERAIEILRETDRAGLMHTDYVGWSDTDPHAICNCCTDCCSPHLAAERLGVSEVWPRRRYRARLDAARCTLCGRCAKRCPFEAFTALGDAEPAGEATLVAGPGKVAGGASRSIAFAAQACRGCGICATGCAEEAIIMEPLGGALELPAGPT